MLGKNPRHKCKLPFVQASNRMRIPSSSSRNLSYEENGAIAHQGYYHAHQAYYQHVGRYFALVFGLFYSNLYLSIHAGTSGTRYYMDRAVALYVYTRRLLAW